jgi:hypothetical protein
MYKQRRLGKSYCSKALRCAYVHIYIFEDMINVFVYIYTCIQKLTVIYVYIRIHVSKNEFIYLSTEMTTFLFNYENV